MLKFSKLGQPVKIILKEQQLSNIFLLPEEKIFFGEENISKPH